MIYVTGDTHGRNDIGKLGEDRWPEGQTLTRDDYVVVCGDFGAIWSKHDLTDEGSLLHWWEDRPWTTLFIDGNHENHDLLDGLEVGERFGSPVHVIPGCPHVIHLMRGYVYGLPVSPGRTASTLVMGGARSVDRMWRVRGKSWWAREMPSNAEYKRCTASLEEVGWKVDYVLTHELPADLRYPALDWRYYKELASSIDPLCNYLQWVYENLDLEFLKRWYAGHYHTDRVVADKVRVLYQDVIRMDDADEGC